VETSFPAVLLELLGIGLPAPHFLELIAQSGILQMRLCPTFSDCAESGLLVDFGLHYDRQLSLSILQVSSSLQASMLPGLKESIPALSSLTVLYDPLELSRERIVHEIRRLCEVSGRAPDIARTWDIPVVYGGEAGPDLEEVALSAGMTVEETVALHAGRDYFIYMLGFLPGFAYLGDLPKELETPRRPTPRARVPAGSVAIAAGLTAIYPLESPGGWHVIGSTPIIPWDMKRRMEPLFQAGDRVCFRAVEAGEAEDIQRMAAEGWTPACREEA
jgi:KipI family sensor histidine kinase inhibitor